MPTDTHAQMNEQHGRWLTDLAMWCQDLDSWQRESLDALQKIRRAEEALREHDQTLRYHAEAIYERRREMEEHERILALFESGALEGQDWELLAAAKEHRSKAHVEQVQTHEKVKKRHHTLMAHATLLLQALSKMS